MMAPSDAAAVAAPSLGAATSAATISDNGGVRIQSVPFGNYDAPSQIEGAGTASTTAYSQPHSEVNALLMELAWLPTYEWSNKFYLV